MEKFILKGKEFSSRLLTGTGKFADKKFSSSYVRS